MVRFASTLLPAMAVALPLQAAPMSWPVDGTPDSEVALHCAAVLASYGQAYVFATELLELADAPSPATMPARVLEAAGGEARLGEVLDLVAGWRPHWESMGRTNFYPILAQSGTPYIADEGEILLDNITLCRTRFDL